MTLYDTKLNEEVLISSVDINGKEQKELYFLGIIPGNKIKKILISVFGNPIAYEIKDLTVALRNEDAKKIKVIKINEL